MLAGNVSTVLANGSWEVTWAELPGAILAASFLVVPVVALIRAHRHDVPKVFDAFTAAFGRRPPLSAQPPDDQAEDATKGQQNR